MSKKKMVLDTSVLIQNIEWLKKNVEEYEYIVPSTVCDELDNQKESHQPRRAFNGRNGLRAIEFLNKSIEFVISDKCHDLPEGFDLDNNDNKILSVAKGRKALLATKDRGLKVKANSIGVECVEIDNEEDKIFKGYKIIELDTRDEEDNGILASIYEGNFRDFNMEQNEYLIIKDVSCPEYDLENDDQFIGYKTLDILRYQSGSFYELKLPPKKVVNPMNDLQKCALDLLNNDSIPIKIIAGGFGSGKTFLSTKMSVFKTIDKGKYSSIMVLRNPSVEGEQIGFLKGSKEEKTSFFFVPFIQHLEGGEFQATSLEQRGVLKKEIIGYIKGLSIGSTFIIVDEAEDLNLKQLKMCGSRIEDTSCICFVGDYKQTHDKFVYSSGLLDLIDKTLYSEYSGVVVLEEDLRSSASKVFADI